MRIVWRASPRAWAIRPRAITWASDGPDRPPRTKVRERLARLKMKLSTPSGSRSFLLSGAEKASQR